MSATAVYPPIGRSPSERLGLALEAFYSRSARRGHPEGQWIDGLWYPSERERRPCCEGIRPTLANRQALDSHCRTQAHVAALFEVGIGELKAAVRDDRKQGSPIARRVATTIVVPRPRAIETFEALRQRTRGQAFEKLRTAVAKGLPPLLRLQALEDFEAERESEMEPLLETASESAAQLLATIDAARRQETFMACAGAFLETLQSALEEPKGKVRRAGREQRESQD